VCSTSPQGPTHSPPQIISHTYTLTHLQTHTHTHTQTHRLPAYLHTHTHTHTHTQAACLLVLLALQTCERSRLIRTSQRHTHSFPQIYLHTHASTRKHTCIHTRLYTHVLTRTGCPSPCTFSPPIMCPPAFEEHVPPRDAHTLLSRPTCPWQQHQCPF